MRVTPQQLGLKQWRAGQQQAIANSVYSRKRFVGQCAPVGSGKSAIVMGEALESGARTLILTASKPLQKQYSDLFGHLGILDVQGKANYQCNAMMPGGEFYDGSPAKSVADAPCQAGEECGLRLGGCSYYDRISAAKYYKRVCTNYAAWISANMYTEGWGKFDLLIADEAHEADSWLAKLLAVRLPRCYTNVTGTKLPNSVHIPTWVAWAGRELSMIRAAVRLEKRAVSQAKRHKRRYSKLRTLQSLENHVTKMSMMTDEWRVFPDQTHILFQPIWIHEYAESLLFGGASKVVFASSTMVPNTINLLGVKDSDLDFFSYPSLFPINRRPVYYYPTVRMRHGMPEEELKACIDVIDSFISMRLDRKGFIPTPSYALQNAILKHSRFASLMVASSQSGTSAGSTQSASMTLARFKAFPTPSILIGPNWNTGIDLKYKTAQYTIIPKMFIPDITDPLLVARAEDHPDYAWYHAGLTFTQAIGRAMRADDDLNETIVLDTAFGRLMSSYRSMVPDWVWSAVRPVNTLPSPAEVLA